MSEAEVVDPFDARYVRGLEGALQAFNRAGLISPSDAHVALRVVRLGAVRDDAVALGVAFAARAPRLGNVCVDLATIHATADADTDAIARSIHDVVAEVQTYVPGYNLLNEPQFDPPSMNSGGQALVTTFIEVEGAGDYLPPYAGNLDIMTASATKVGEEIAKETLSVSGGAR